MKKVLLGATLLFSVMTFAQKEELKTLKKIYAKTKPSDKDLVEYETAIKSLEGLATEEADKVYKNFYKGMFPMVKLASLGEKVTPNDQMKLVTKENLDNMILGVNETLNYEKNTGKKVYTDDITQKLATVKPMLMQLAFQYNNEKKYKEGANLFYNIYLLDKSDGGNLENAAILSIQAGDTKSAENYYDELIASDFVKTGVKYYATNVATGQEELMPDKASRMQYISLKTHEKPRDEKMIDRLPEFLKMGALVASQNGNNEKAIANFEKARSLKPNDDKLNTEEALVYYNIAYNLIKDDASMVDKINNTKDRTVVEGLIKDRKEIYNKALPYFEKAVQLNPEDAGMLDALKITYEVLEMKDKLSQIEK